MQKQGKKEKIRQPSLALSPEHLQRKGRKQSSPLDYVFQGFPEPHTSLKKNETKEPVPEGRGLCREPNMNRSPEFSCHRTTASRLPFPPYLYLGISLLLSFLFLLSCFIFLPVFVFFLTYQQYDPAKVIMAKAEGRLLYVKKKKNSLYIPDFNHGCRWIEN